MMEDIRQLLNIYRGGGGEGQNEYKERTDDQVQANLKGYYYVFQFNSPYEEVRASVPNTDVSSLPVETFRAWFLGIFFGSLFGAVNQVI